MPKRPQSLIDATISARTHERDSEKRDDFATWTLGVDVRPCIFDCNRMTTNADGICDAHDLEPGGKYWGKALTVEQVRREMRRVRWDVG